MASAVAELFDAMAPTYDELEPWYEHLYDVLHTILRDTIGRAPTATARALDAGCGTGFQSALLTELGWVLRPGGRLLLDCEHRPSLDIVWMLASALTGDALGYGVPAWEAWRAVAARGPLRLAYPGYGLLWLFTRRELTAMLRAAGLRPLRVWGLHSITNLIPSTVLHGERVPRTLAAAYRALRRLDVALIDTAPARALANSLVVLAERSQPRA